MPAKNTIKPYVENGYYHIYNRGVEKRIIFQDKQDYKVFLYYLKIYLSPPEPLDSPLNQKKETFTGFIKPPRDRPLNNLYQEVDLLAYCLMPNHFHLLIKQKPANGIEKFMRSLATKYVQYFNKRHKRIGPLFQGPYKAVLIENDEQLLHLSRYIHLNPIKDIQNQKENPLNVQRILLNSYSSYADYLGQRKTEWLNIKEILKSIGLDEKRLMMGYCSAAEGQKFQQTAIEFDKVIRQLGPSPLRPKGGTAEKKKAKEKAKI